MAEEASNYVESVMAVNNAEKVATTPKTHRKRQHSLTEVETGDEPNKKVKTDNITDSVHSIDTNVLK
jgi:hypothetical protein